MQNLINKITISLMVLILCTTSCSRKKNKSSDLTYEKLPHTKGKAGSKVMFDKGTYLFVDESFNERIDHLIIPLRLGKGAWINVTDNKINLGRLLNRKENISKPLQFLIDGGMKHGLNKYFFPKGDYLLSQVHIPPGIHFYGERGSWIRKMPNSGKYSRMFTTQNKYHSGKKDSQPIIFEYLNFDGNREKQGAYKKYELEHQAMLFLSADHKSSGRLKVKIENCHFKEGVGDAISIHRNIDAVINNCSAHNVFRGGITITGGYTKVKVNNFNATGDVHSTGIDVEVDGGGYKGSFAVDVHMQNITLAGDFDVAIREGEFYGNKITVLNPPYQIGAKNGKILIENSTFHGGEEKEATIRYPKDVAFHNCKFILGNKTNSNSLCATNVFWKSKYHVGKNQQLKFTDCEFILKGNSSSETTAIYNTPSDKADNSRLILDNCKILGAFDKGIEFKYGGSGEIRDTKIEAKIPLKIGSLNNKTYTFNYDLKLINVDANTKIIECSDHEKNKLVIERSKLSVPRTKKTLIKQKQ